MAKNKKKLPLVTHTSFSPPYTSNMTFSRTYAQTYATHVQQHTHICTYATHNQKVAKLSAATWRISSISCRSILVCSGWDLRVLPPGEYHVITYADALNSIEFCIVRLFLRHFVRHLGICNPICVKLLQLIVECVFTHNSVKKTKSLYINKWLTYSQL